MNTELHLHVFPLISPIFFFTTREKREGANNRKSNITMLVLILLLLQKLILATILRCNHTSQRDHTIFKTDALLS